MLMEFIKKKKYSKLSIQCFSSTLLLLQSAVDLVRVCLSVNSVTPCPCPKACLRTQSSLSSDPSSANTLVRFEM